MKPKKAKGITALVKKAEKEMYKFQLNEPFYTINDLIKLGLESTIPNLTKLNQKCKNVKILNLGNMPVLSYRNTGDVE